MRQYLDTACGHSMYLHALSMWTQAVSTCPVHKFQIGILQRTGSGRNPAVFYDLYRHTFLCGDSKSCLSERAGWSVPAAPGDGRGDGRKWAISGHLVLVENGPFRGWPMGGSFSATAYGHLIPYPYLERDFRLFRARVWSSDSTGQDRVVPRNFIAGSGSNVCNNFPPADRPPLHPPWLLL